MVTETRYFNIILFGSLEDGKVVIDLVRFIVDKDGTVKVIRTFGAHPLLLKEARRIIELLPRMIPGERGGRAVRVPFAVPINFYML